MREIILLVFLLYSFSANSQDSSATQQDSSKVKRSYIPVLFYLPETGLGLGATVINTKKPKNEFTRPSQYIIGTVYTLKNQILFYVPFEFYGNRNINRFKGEIGYYLYFYNYYGLGRQSQIENLENYDVNFPRTDFNYARLIAKDLYLGIGFNSDYFNITKTKENGLLQSDKPIGYQGGSKANLYGFLLYDSRDVVNAPQEGHYMELRFSNNLPSPLADFKYRKYRADFRKYFSFREKYVVATNFTIDHASAGTPFFDLPYLATGQIARGLNDRRYINNTIVFLQGELRFPIYKKIRGAAFYSLNAIPDTVWGWLDETPISTFGLGLRYELLPESRTRLRLDAAYGEGSFNIYFTINEAF